METQEIVSALALHHGQAGKFPVSFADATVFSPPGTTLAECFVGNDIVKPIMICLRMLDIIKQTSDYGIMQFTDFHKVKEGDHMFFSLADGYGPKGSLPSIIEGKFYIYKETGISRRYYDQESDDFYTLINSRVFHLQASNTGGINFGRSSNDMREFDNFWSSIEPPPLLNVRRVETHTP